MEKKTKMVYVTKNWNTIGIEHLQVEETNVPHLVAEVLQNKGLYQRPRHFHKGDWFLSKEEAICRANKLKHLKILSLKKQIQKIESKIF